MNKSEVIRDLEKLICDQHERLTQSPSDWLQQKKDAERYRFLREKSFRLEDWNIAALGSVFERESDFDEAVDEHMEGGE